MSTRGAWGFVIDGQEKITYNHFDSYPDGLGVDILHWLRDVLENGEDALKEQVRRLTVVDGDTKPTDKQIEALKMYANTSVSTGSLDEWYVLLRDTQGDPMKTVEAGYMLDGHRFPLDSLFCEWAYVIDLDNRSFDVYQGFQRQAPRDGRWVGAEGERDTGYHPVSRIASYSFDALPSDAKFSKLEELDDDEDDDDD